MSKQQTKTIDLSSLRERQLTLRSEDINQDARTASLSFSSEAPADRFGFDEVLLHGRTNVRLSRLSDGAPLLVNHDPDQHVGVVERAHIDVGDRVGRAVVRFSRSEEGERIYRDVLDGIRGKVSLTYKVHHESERPARAASGRPVMEVDDWEPYEVSIVSVPLDHGVGVGRSADLKPEAKTMTDDTKQENKAEKREPDDDQITAMAERRAKEMTTREMKRRDAIMDMARDYNAEELAREYVERGAEPGEFYKALLKERKRGDDEARTVHRHTPEAGGLTDSEARDFRITRLVRAMIEPGSSLAQREASLELEVSRQATEAAQRAGMKVRGAMIPNKVLRQPMPAISAERAAALRGRAALNVGTATAGAELVATNLLAGDFIDVLRNSLAVARAGARLLTDLDGNVAIPRKTAGSTAAWIGTEGGDAAESVPTFDQVTLTPRTLGAYTEATRQLLLQSSIDVEALIRDDIAQGLALEIDRAALYGSGAAGQPTGLTGQTGVTTTIATATPSYAQIVSMETAVGAANALMGNLAYMFGSSTLGHIKTTEKATGTAVFLFEAGGTLNGYPIIVSNQIETGDVIFGNWSDLLIGLWGGLDILVDPFTGGLSGTIRIVAHQSIDIAVRHGVSFDWNDAP